MFGRRALRRRLEALAARLQATPVDMGAPAGIEASLHRLERAVDAASTRLDTSEDAASRLSGAIEAVAQAVVVVDAEGNEVFRNELARALTSGHHTEALVEQAVQEQLRAALEGTPQRQQLDLLGPPRRILVVQALPLDDGARLTGAVAVIDDVSERKRLDAVRRDFVANISHELRTPVGALGLLAETIVEEDDPSVVRRLAQRMMAETDRVGRIIDDLLALRRIEAEEQPAREPVPADVVVAEAIDRVRTVAEARAIRIVTDDVADGFVVRGDRRQLVAAVANLVDNACKYSDDGSSIEVTAGGDGAWVEIVVRDEGIGIPSRDLDRIFERFYRVDRARSRATGGTGLGLAIVRHVAASHRGEVLVESREGEGSSFTLRLPAGPGPLSVSA